jgi:hypothetical protein
MLRHWNPTAVLELYNDGRCVGYAPSKRRKCSFPIKMACQTACNALVLDLSEQPLDAIMLAPKLERLARLMLCLRNHQNQVEDMVRKWSDMIEAAYPPPPSTASPSHIEIRVLEDEISATLRRRRTLEWCGETSRHVFPDAIANSQARRGSASTTSTTDLSGSSTPSAASISRTGVTPSDLPASTSPQTTRQGPLPPSALTRNTGHVAIVRRPSSATSRSPQPVPPPRSRTGTHVRPLPLGDASPVCREDLPAPESGRAPPVLSWCKWLWTEYASKMV